MQDKLSRRDFGILTALERTGGEALTQREIAHACRCSAATVNRALPILEGKRLIERGRITEAGLEALEPYRVKRAVLIAAGFGARLIPITLNTPKPLVRVKGKRIIDSILDALCAVGIDEVYVVRGYLFEQFDQLLYKYPNVRFIENPLYTEANNISSIVAARDHLSNAYVCESDLLLNNPDLISRYQYSSNYLGVPVDVTDDWCFQTRKGIITDLTIGGTNCHHMFGISYWTAEDGLKLADDAPAAMAMPGGKERYWDEVPCKCFPKHYTISIRECSFADINEIDTFRELQALDPAYR